MFNYLANRRAMDFKTSTTKAEHVDLYSRQLHAYAYALEHATPGSLALAPVSKLGLIVFEPTQFSDGSRQDAHLSGKLTWLEIPKDENGFLGFLSEVLDVLDLPSPPQAPLTCGWCSYREEALKSGL